MHSKTILGVLALGGGLFSENVFLVQEVINRNFWNVLHMGGPWRLGEVITFWEISELYSEGCNHDNVTYIKYIT